MSDQLEIPARYKLSKMGPMGGQASLFFARDLWLERDVILKAGIPGAGYNAAAEVRSMASVSSKHVASIYDTISDKNGKIAAIVEEDVKGEQFEALFQKALSVVDKLRFIYQLSSGVVDMHKAGRVHRDLKPNNMKVRSDGLLKIFDFGISTVLSDGDETLVGKGTYGYKSPELYGKPPIKVSSKCDVYSIGVIAHQLLSDGGMSKHFNNFAPAPEGLVTFDALTGAGKMVTAVLNSCLSTDPSKRPEAEEVRDALAAEIVRGQHRGVLVSDGQRFLVDKQKPAVKVGDSGNEMTVEYTGTSFKIRQIIGDVYVNNKPAAVGEKLTGAMVLTLGGPMKGASRKFITFDISHPEILV